jgi:stearoyl-CoA desaturase (delta-9 desaturase)
MKIKVNSAAHKWGNTPYDQRIEARECIVRHLLQGEGFHNYHHTFPSVHIYYFYHFFQ